MVLLYNTARSRRQVKGSIYDRELRGDGTTGCVMHFVVLNCWHVFGYAVFLLCNKAASGNDCRRKERGISGATREMLKIVKKKVQIVSDNKINLHLRS